MKSLALLLPTIAAMLIASGAGPNAQDDAPKPSVTVTGTCVYLGTPRDNIVVTLVTAGEPTPAQESQDPEPEAEKAKPLTATTNEKGAFEFKNVPIGKYRMTAKGRPQNSIRAYKEADPVDLEITADTASPVEKKITLTLDRAR